jgi:cyclohexyl-isocyanide hydratase
MSHARFTSQPMVHFMCGNRADVPFRIGFLIFPNLTLLDLTGPYEVLSKIRGAELFLVWKTRDPILADSGFTITPTVTLADCPQLDLICVPGGLGVGDLLADVEVLDFLREQSESARYMTSVCTGALILGAAGLLTGHRAVTHWTAMEFLESFGAVPVDDRVVVDGKVVTGGGVTAGVDFGLRLVAEISGEETARAVQLAIEYDPRPPFDCGHPRLAEPALVERMRARLSMRQAERRTQVEKAAAALNARKS